MSNNEDELYKKLGRLEFEVERLKQSHEEFKTIIVMVLIVATITYLLGKAGLK